MHDLLLFFGGFVSALWFIYGTLHIQDKRARRQPRRGGLIDLTGHQAGDRDAEGRDAPASTGQPYEGLSGAGSHPAPHLRAVSGAEEQAQQ